MVPIKINKIYCEDFDSLMIEISDSDSDIIEFRDDAVFEIQGAELIFVLVDVTNAEKCETACHIAELFNNRHQSCKHSVCVCYGSRSDSLLSLQGKYNNVIYVANKDELKQIPVMIVNMFNNDIVALEYADVLDTLNKTPIEFYYQFNLTDVFDTSAYLLALKSDIANEGCGDDDILNAIIHFTISPTTGLEDIAPILNDVCEIIKGNIIWNVCVNKEMGDRDLYISMLCGKDNHCVDKDEG